MMVDFLIEAEAQGTWVIEDDHEASLHRFEALACHLSPCRSRSAASRSRAHDNLQSGMIHAHGVGVSRFQEAE